MKIALLSDEVQWEELKTALQHTACIRCSNEKEFFESDADIYMNMLHDAAEKNYTAILKPVIINSVVDTLQEKEFSDNVIRINGWPGFLSRDEWEAAGKMNELLEHFFNRIKKIFISVPDQSGMIAARIIAMIINEAYYALDENISTREEIDIAMKLGTNYPYGPFEWSDKIGIEKIYALLYKLSIHDKRYLPAPLLQKIT